MSKIRFNDFLRDKIIVNSDANNFIDALKFLVENEKDCSIVYYDECLEVIINPNNVDENGNIFYIYNFERSADYITDIYVNRNDVKLTFYLNDTQVNGINPFIFAACIYQQLKVKITFLKGAPLNNKIFIFNKRYIVNNDDRYTLMFNKIETDYLIFNNGSCELKLL